MVPEPVRLEDEGRVDDVAKAQEMANASRFVMDDAIRHGKIATGETPIPATWDTSRFDNKAEVREHAGEVSKNEKFFAGVKENVAGEKYDAEKQAKLEEVKKELGIE